MLFGWLIVRLRGSVLLRSGRICWISCAVRDTLIDTELQVSAEIVRARSSVTAVFDREVGLERVLRGALGVD